MSQLFSKQIRYVHNVKSSNCSLNELLFIKLMFACFFCEHSIHSDRRYCLFIYLVCGYIRHRGYFLFSMIGKPSLIRHNHSNWKIEKYKLLPISYLKCWNRLFIPLWKLPNIIIQGWDEVWKYRLFKKDIIYEVLQVSTMITCNGCIRYTNFCWLYASDWTDLHFFADLMKSFPIRTWLLFF